MVQVGTG